MTVVVTAGVVVAVVVVVVPVSLPVAEPALFPVTAPEPVPAFNVAFTGDVLGLLVTTDAGAFKLDCVVDVSSLTFCVCETEWSGIEIKS